MESGSETFSSFPFLGKRTHGNVKAAFSLSRFVIPSCEGEGDLKVLATKSKSFASSREGTKLKIVNFCNSFGSRPVITKKKAFPVTQLLVKQSPQTLMPNQNTVITHMQQSFLNRLLTTEEY
jgi:hypothetical protein